MRRSLGRRDPTTLTRAREAEAYAARSDSDADWQVAADAWEEAGDLLRAEQLRKKKRIDALIARWNRYDEARRAFDPRRYQRGGGYTPEDIQAIERSARTSRLSNEESAEIEMFRFIIDPPLQWFTYRLSKHRREWEPASSRGVVGTWTGQPLGEIVAEGKPRVPFSASKSYYGRGPGRISSVRVRAINGYDYVGTCAHDSGDYCKLRRSTSWRYPPPKKTRTR